MANPNVKNYIPVGLSSFFGGQSVDSKLGTQAQFYDDLHTDFRSNPSNLTVLPGTSECSDGVVTGLLLAMDQVNSGDRYSIDLDGKVYKTAASTGIWTSPGTLGQNSGAGLVYRADFDNIYFSGQSKLGRIFHVSTANTFQADFFENGVSAFSGCTKTGGADTYTLPTSITEDAVNSRNFTTDIEPGYKIGVKVVDKGTGDWTLTLHDDANTVLGTVTVDNGDLTNGAINYFVFSSQIRLIPSIPGEEGTDPTGGLTYHFHLTSTVADGTVQTTTSSSLADCDMEFWADALVETRNGLHPMVNFNNLTLIGNGEYVAAYEPLQDRPTTSDFKRHRLVLPPGYEVCGFGNRNLMTVVAAEKRSTDGEYQEGALFFWNGISVTYDDWWPVPEGSPESLFAAQNTVYNVTNGVLTRVEGSDEPTKIRTIRNTSGVFTDTVDVTHVYPNMMTVHRGILLIGYPSQTTNESIRHGIYSYGVISREYPLSFGYSYSLSTGTMLNDGANNLRIGMIKSYGDTLYMSWRDDSAAPSYGVDIVNNFADPAPVFALTPLVYDGERPYAYKHAAYITASFEPWPADATLVIKYKLDNDADWTYATIQPAFGDQTIMIPVERRFLVATFAFDGTCATVSPSISSFYLWVDPLTGERPVGDG